MIILYGIVKNKIKKTITVLFFFSKYILKLKLIIIKKNFFFIHDERNESIKGDFIFFFNKFPKSKLKLYCLFKIFVLNKYD